MTSRVRALVASLAVLTAAPILAQQAPVRDAGASTAIIGTASLAGRVMSDETPARPLRRATVRLGGVGFAGGQLAITSDDGSFVFTGLAPGRYTVSATRAGFVATSYGAKRPDGPGSAIGLAEGQRVTNIQLRMLRGAVITGTIRDQNSEPVAGMTIAVMRYGFNPQTGERTLQSTRGFLADQTDDRGVFRTYGLPPGEYLVLVTQGFSSGRGGNEVHQMTAADVQWATRATATGPTQGPVQSATSVTPPPASAPPVVYAPVFYPGTVVESSATRVTLRAGEERRGVDIPLIMVPTASIRGTITTTDSALPPGFQVNLLAHERIEGLPFSGFGTAPSVTNGRFTFTGVTPGDYTIAVRPTAVAPGGRGAPVAPVSPATLAQFGLSDVTVSGQDLDVVVPLRPGVTVSGRLAFDKSASPPPADLSRVRVSLTAVVVGNGAAIGVPAATADAAGAFSFPGVAPGRYRVSASIPGSTQTSGWRPLTAMVAGRDAYDVPFDVGTNDVGDAVLVFTDHPAELAGSIQDAAGQPAAEYFIIVFASNEAFWTPQSRRIQAKRPGSDGQFSFPNMPPGEYLMAAVTDVEQGEWFDPAFLTQLRAAAIKITVGEGEKKVQDIRVAIAR